MFQVERTASPKALGGGVGGDGPAHLKNRITVAVAEMDGERCREGHIYATGDGRK